MDAKSFTGTNLEIHRERILSEIARIKRTENSAPSPQDVEALFNRAAFVSNKANILASAISEEAEKLYIPVHPAAIEVAAAVSRKSADSPQGDKISFDLFKDAVEAMQRMKKETEEIITVGREVEPASVLQKRIKKLRAKISMQVSTGQEPDDDLLEILVSQFLLLWIAHRLMMPFEGMEVHLPLSQTWEEKVSGGSEVEIVLSVLLGLAAQLMIMNLNDDLAEKYLDEASGGFYPAGYNAKTLIAEARNIEQTRDLQLAQMQVGLSDYEIILEYASDYLSNTTEPGYEMWTAYVDTVQMRNSAQSIWVQAPHYSISHALVSQEFQPQNRKKRKRYTQSNDAYNERVDIELERAIIAGLVPMSQMSYVARKDALDGLDDNLDLIAQVLSADAAVEMACCLGLFLEKLNPDVLKAVRGFLNGLLRAYAFDLNNVLTAIYSHLVSPNFEEIYALEAMHQIDKVFDKLYDKIFGFFGDDIDPLLCCDFLGALIETIIDSVVRLEAELKGAVKIFAGKLVQSISIGELGIKDRYTKSYDMRIIRKMIMIIDAVLRAVESMDACSESKRMVAPLPAAVRDSIRLPTIKINEDEKKNYFSSALPKELSSGKFLPAVGDMITALRASPETLGGLLNPSHRCGEPYDDDLLDKAITNFVST